MSKSTQISGIPDELWEAFKQQIPSNITINDYIINIIKNHIDNKKR